MYICKSKVIKCQGENELLRNDKETVTLFDDWAKTYDQDVENASGPLLGYDQSLAQAARMLNVSDHERLLDVGIGTGTFAQMVSGGIADVWGVDLSAQMLEQCQEKHPNYHLRQGTFTETTIASERFDYVISSFCFHEVMPNERSQAVEEMYRLLVPGGKCLILDIMFVSDAAEIEAKKEIGKYWDATEDYSRISVLDELLRQTGFQNVQWVNTAPYHWAVVGRK